MSPKPPRQKRRTWLPVVPKAGQLDRREVQRLAEQGVGFEDVVLALRIGPRLERDPKLREEIERLVEWHAARFRAALARRLYHEGVHGGRAMPLIALGRTHVGLDGEAIERPAEHGVTDRLLALLEQLDRNRKAASK